MCSNSAIPTIQCCRPQSVLPRRCHFIFALQRCIPFFTKYLSKTKTIRKFYNILLHTIVTNPYYSSLYTELSFTNRQKATCKNCVVFACYLSILSFDFLSQTQFFKNKNDIFSNSNILIELKITNTKKQAE